jgi:hypothetical protein
VPYAVTELRKINFLHAKRGIEEALRISLATVRRVNPFSFVASRWRSKPRAIADTGRQATIAADGHPWISGEPEEQLVRWKSRGTGLAEKLANEAAFQALEEARALAAEAQQDRVAAQAAWHEADRIKAELAAISAAHAARSAELDSHARVIEMRERELETTLNEVAALKSEYQSKLAALEAIVKGPARQA